MSNYRIIDVETIALRFKALGHPHRLKIFRQLAGCCGRGTSWGDEESMHRCVGELAAELEVAPSTVSHHLKELTRAGLITTERCGREIRCWVEPSVLHDLAGFFTNFIVEPSSAESRSNCETECYAG